MPTLGPSQGLLVDPTAAQRRHVTRPQQRRHVTAERSRRTSTTLATSAPNNPPNDAYTPPRHAAQLDAHSRHVTAADTRNNGHHPCHVTAEG